MRKDRLIQIAEIQSRDDLIRQQENEIERLKRDLQNLAAVIIQQERELMACEEFIAVQGEVITDLNERLEQCNS